MGNNNLQELIDTIFGLYYVTFPMADRLPVSITFTDDLNKSHAELRPDLIEHLKRDNPQSDFNGRMVIPERVGDQIHILLNNAKVTEYTQDGSMTWVGTIAHEYTHALDFDGIAQQDRLDSYSIIEQGSKYSMFHQWTEYHARKRGYSFLRKFMELIGRMPEKDVQISHIINTEAPYQTRLFENWYQNGTPNDRLYCTMQYLGRYSVWMDLFPDVFQKGFLLELTHKTFWMWDILKYLREHEELNQIYGHFDELKEVLSENWKFE